MAVIRPFKAVRPRMELASSIAALPYDVYNRKEAGEVIKKQPLSFLKVDRAETQFPDEVDTYDERVYKRAKHTLDAMIREGDFVRDEEDCYYIYELEMAGRIQTGLVACASIDDYLNNVIKKHENTREEKELDRIHHVDACSAQTGPIFLAYRNNEIISHVIDLEKENVPIYDFVSEDGIGHRTWMIYKDDHIEKIRTAFQEIQNIYIADGHHRAASAVKVGLKRREENPGYTGQEEFNYFLSVLFPDEQLQIMDYNRVVKDLNGLSEEAFLEKIQEVFVLEDAGTDPYRPVSKGEIGMFLDTKWYKLTVKSQYQSQDPVEGLDVSILQNAFLEPVLGIKDPKVDSRIDFVGGIRGLKELEKRVHTDSKVAFAMYPTSIAELFAVADAGRLMPPKSTWFEPKLRSGLFLHFF